MLVLSFIEEESEIEISDKVFDNRIKFISKKENISLNVNSRKDYIIGFGYLTESHRVLRFRRIP